MQISDNELSQNIIRPIEKQMPQALTIFKLAKQEARRLGRNIVGTEMILLGILGEGTGVAIKVLNDLGVYIKDARQVVESLIAMAMSIMIKKLFLQSVLKKYSKQLGRKQKKHNQARIYSEHLLYAITTEPNQ